MDVLHDRCAALDVAKDEVKVCVRTPGKRRNTRHTEVRTFITMTNDLLAMRDWLTAERVSLVVMEATGGYEKPLAHFLQGQGRSGTPGLVQAAPGHRRAGLGRRGVHLDGWGREPLCRNHGLVDRTGGR